MKALDILNNLKSSYMVGFDSENILIDLPGGGEVILDSGLKEEVIEHKQEILFHLRNREYNRLTAQAHNLAAWLNDPAAAPLAARKEKLPEYEDTVEQIAALEPVIQHYEQSGLTTWYEKGWLLLFSEPLHEVICIVRDPKIKLPAGCTGYPVYRLEEVTALSGKTDEAIKSANQVKKVFKGAIHGK